MDITIGFCVRAETGQIIAKTETNPQSDNMETDLQSEMAQTDTMQHLLDDLELTQVQKMLDDMLGENSFSLTDTLVSLTRGEKIFFRQRSAGDFFTASFLDSLKNKRTLYQDTAADFTRGSFFRIPCRAF